MISRHNHPTPNQVYADSLNGLPPVISAGNGAGMEKGLTTTGTELYTQDRPVRPYYADLPVCGVCGLAHSGADCPLAISGGGLVDQASAGEPVGQVEVEERALAA